MGDSDSGPRELGENMPDQDVPSGKQAPRASGRGSRHRAHVARSVKKLPWSDKTVVLVGLVLVVIFAPAWVDPPTFGGLEEPDGPASSLPLLAPVARPLPSFGPPIAGGPVVVIARDTLDRTVVEGWGRAELGGPYATVGLRPDFAVEPGSGLLRLPAADVRRAAYLPEVSGRDVDFTVSAELDRLPQTGSLFLYALVRRTQTGFAYQPKIIVTQTGAVFAHAGVLRADGEQSMGSPVLVPGLEYEPGRAINLRATATGSDPTSVRVRTWLDGEPEPEHWHFSAVDWTGRLQDTGSVGVAAYLGSRVMNAPAVLRVRDILATTTDLTTSNATEEPSGDN